MGAKGVGGWGLARSSPLGKGHCRKTGAAAGRGWETGREQPPLPSQYSEGWSSAGAHMKRCQWHLDFCTLAGLAVGSGSAMPVSCSSLALGRHAGSPASQQCALQTDQGGFSRGGMGPGWGCFISALGSVCNEPSISWQPRSCVPAAAGSGTWCPCNSEAPDAAARGAAHTGAVT